MRPLLALALLTPAALAAPIEPAWQAGQILSHSGEAEVIELGGEHPGLSRLRLEQTLIFVSPEAADGGWRVAGTAEVRDEVAAEMREPRSVFFSGYLGPRGTWEQAHALAWTGGFFPLWSPQLALGPLPPELPEGEPFEVAWPLWAGDTRLDGTFRIQRLRALTVHGRTFERWLATLTAPVEDESAGVSVPSMTIEVTWDSQAGAPVATQTIATLAWPAERRQTQARITFHPAGEMLVDAGEARRLPDQVDRLEEIAREMIRKPRRVPVLAQDFLQTYPDSRFGPVAEAFASAASPEGG